jgi:hypothetical protein
LNGPLETGDIVRVNAGIVTTASGSLTVGLTDTTVGADTSIPTCSIYAATGTATITVTCSELVVQNGTLDTDVDTKVTVGGVAVASGALGSGGANLGTASKTVTITRGAGTWSGTGAAIVIQKDLLKDLGGNKVAQLTGTMITDTAKPTVVGLPTYTLANKAVAQKIFGNILLVAKTAGSGGNAITWTATDDNSAGSISVATKAITFLGNLDAAQKTNTEVCALVNAHASASALVTCYLSGAEGNFTTDTDAALAGGTSTLTVTTTFSEAVTVDAVTDIKYNADGADGNEVNYATVSGSGTTSVTTTYTLNGTTHQANPAANTSEMLYAAAIPDLATNTLTSVTPLLSAP